MKKLKILVLSIAICGLLSFWAMLQDLVSVYAEQESNYIDTESVYIEQGNNYIDTAKVSYALFGDKIIESSGYLYNLNDSADYVYTKFENTGYAIYFRETGELLEYAPDGRLPYPDTIAKKYYAGPTNYLSKESAKSIKESKFINAVTNESVFLSNEAVEMYSNQIQGIFSKRDKEQACIETDSENEQIMPLTVPGSGGDPKEAQPGATYISNSDYFFVAPTHGNNRDNSCGAVAAQLLLSYNNYYNDRRIIEPKHLNGGWKGANSDDITNRANYTYPENNPNACNNPMTMSSWTLGSDDSYHAHIRDKYIPPASIAASLKSGLEKIVNDRNINSTVGWDSTLGLFAMPSSFIKAEINADRPLILELGWFQTGFTAAHYVVGYGYQDYRDNGKDYFGYVVHYGWRNDETETYTNRWVSSSWCISYVTLKVNHNHNYIDTGINHGGDTMREFRCACGHRKLDNLYNVSGNTITGVRYPVSGNVTIPAVINGTEITAIGNGSTSVFTGQNITRITFDSNYSIATIAAKAFANCTQLSQISIPASVTTIGANAFSGCSALSIYAQRTSAPSTWTSYNPQNRPIFWGCSLLSNYVYSFTKAAANPQNANAANGISAPSRQGYDFGGWATSSTNATIGIVAYTAANVNSAPNGTTLYAIWVAVTPWVQPTWTSNSNTTGTIAASGTYSTEHPWKAFNGTMMGDGDEWSVNATSGWLQLKLDSYIVVHSIEFYNGCSDTSNRTKAAKFTGRGGIALGNSFIAPNQNLGYVVINVGGVLTNIIQLNISSSYGSYVNVSQIVINATVPSSQPNSQAWTQPVWTNATNPNGVFGLKASGTYSTEQPWKAFNGTMTGDGDEWTVNAKSGWIELTLEYPIYITSIDVWNNCSTGSNRSKAAQFRIGSDGAYLGGSFTFTNQDKYHVNVPVGGVWTNVIRLNISSSYGTYVGVSEIKINAIV